MVTGGDYKDRVREEYSQLLRRMDNLGEYINTHTCHSILHEQYGAMAKYRDILRQRAEIEGITLEGI